MTATAPALVGIYRYPVKGLSADAMTTVNVGAGETLPFDRAWAIENGRGDFDPAAPRFLPKIHFLMLMRDERLAALETRFEEATRALTVLRGGKAVVSGQLSLPAGRLVIEQFFAAFMKQSLRGAPRIVSAPGHSFTDSRTKCLHIVNLASVRELERIAGRAVDPLRFRPNLVIDGAAPWTESSWVGREIQIGGAKLSVMECTERCAATNVDPATGARDMDIPAILGRKWSHTDFGIYAKIAVPGALTVGDTVTTGPAAPS
jgi:uncharacterized protein YcbX